MGEEKGHPQNSFGCAAPVPVPVKGHPQISDPPAMRTLYVSDRTADNLCLSVSVTPDEKSGCPFCTFCIHREKWVSFLNIVNANTARKIQSILPPADFGQESEPMVWAGGKRESRTRMLFLE